MTSTAKLSQESEKQALMLKIRQRAAVGKTYWKENWDNAERDLQFLDGKQWDEDEKTSRENEGRPCITNNVLPAFVDVVIGEARQDRSQIKVLQTGFKSVKDIQLVSDLKIPNVANTETYSLTDALNGLIRQIEYNSDAETAYDTALENSVQSSMGYLRVYSDWLNENSFDQHVLIKNIDNQFNVILDPLATEFDYSDMNWAIVDSMVDKSTFQESYPKANISTAGLTDANDWITDDSVRVSEYFERKPYTKTIHLMSDRTVIDDESYKKIGDELQATGVTSVKTREVKCYKVIWRKITAHDVLEGPVELPCSTIPIVPVWGKRLVIKNRKQYKSFIRNALDAQRQANYFESAATESVSLSPKSPFIASATHVEDNPEDWENANKETRSVLVYKQMHDHDPGPKRQAPAAMPAAEITMGMNAVEKIKSTIGMYDASLGAAGNETSGKAIIARQKQGDRGSFAFTDNLTKAKRRVGKLVIEYIMNTYDTQRVEKIRFEDGSEDFIELNQSILDQQTKEWVTVNDFSVASYEARVDTGPSYATQREESADTMLSLAQTLPNIGPLIADLIADNLNINGKDEIVERIKKTLSLDLLKPGDREKILKDREEMQGSEPQEPPPEVVLKEIELQIEQIKLENEKLKAELQAKEIKADIVKADIEADQMMQSQANDQDQMIEQVRSIVADALSELLSQAQNPQPQVTQNVLT